MLGLQVHRILLHDYFDLFLFYTGGTQTLFCVEVGEKDKVGPGGGLVEEGEMINVVEMTVTEAKEYISRQDSQNQDVQ